MKFSTTLIALVAAGLASAQLPDVPPCSLNCFVSALTSDGCSDLLDFNCHCKKTELVSTITPCVEKACEYEDRISVSNAVVGQCSSAGVPISIPPIETGKATTTAAQTTTEASTTAEETSSAKPTESASSSEGEGESSTTPAPTTTAAATTPAGSTAVGSSGVVSTPLVSKTDSAPASSSSPAFNGAGSVKGNMAGVAALAAAAAYIL